MTTNNTDAELEKVIRQIRLLVVLGNSPDPLPRETLVDIAKFVLADRQAQKEQCERAVVESYNQGHDDADHHHRDGWENEPLNIGHNRELCRFCNPVLAALQREKGEGDVKNS